MTTLNCTADEAAAILRISRSTFDRHVRRLLNGVRFSGRGHVLYRIADVVALNDRLAAPEQVRNRPRLTGVMSEAEALAMVEETCRKATQRSTT